MGKPRMVKSDAWKKRPVVERYWAIKDFMILQASLQKFKLRETFQAVIWIPMPKSWSKKKKIAMAGSPHRQVPDADNLIKAVQDILLKEDSHVWKFCVSKHWQGDVYSIDYKIMIENIKS